jgi:hypothetical protein
MFIEGKSSRGRYFVHRVIRKKKEKVQEEKERKEQKGETTSRGFFSPVVGGGHWSKLRRSLSLLRFVHFAFPGLLDVSLSNLLSTFLFLLISDLVEQAPPIWCLFSYFFLCRDPIPRHERAFRDLPGRHCN